jgi:excisionase family DNA binding protein
MARGLSNVDGEAAIAGAQVLTVSEAAAFLRVSVGSVRKWSNAGALRSFRLGPRQDRRFLLGDLLKFVTNRPIEVADGEQLATGTLERPIRALNRAVGASGEQSATPSN